MISKELKKAEILSVKAEPFGSYIMDYLLAHPLSTLYNVPSVYRLDKNTDRENLLSAWEKVRNIHRELNSVFVKKEDGWYLTYSPQMLRPVELVKTSEENITEVLLDAVEAFHPGHLMVNTKLIETEDYLYLFMDICYALMDGQGRKNLHKDLMKAWGKEYLPPDDYFALRDKREKWQSLEDRHYYLDRYDNKAWSMVPVFDNKERGSARYVFVELNPEIAYDIAPFTLSVMKALRDYNKASDILLTWYFHGRLSKEEQNCGGFFSRDLPIGIHFGHQTDEELLLETKEQIKNDIVHMAYPYALNELMNKPVLYTLFADDLYDISPLDGVTYNAEYLLEVGNEISDNALIIEYRKDHQGCFLSLKYDSGLYEKESIERFGQMVKDYMETIKY